MPCRLCEYCREPLMDTDAVDSVGASRELPAHASSFVRLARASRYTSPYLRPTIAVPPLVHPRISPRNPNMKRPWYGVGTALVRSRSREYTPLCLPPCMFFHTFAGIILHNIDIQLAYGYRHAHIALPPADSASRVHPPVRLRAGARVPRPTGPARQPQR